MSSDQLLSFPVCSSKTRAKDPCMGYLEVCISVSRGHFIFIMSDISQLGSNSSRPPDSKFAQSTGLILIRSYSQCHCFDLKLKIRISICVENAVISLAQLGVTDKLCNE